MSEKVKKIKVLRDIEDSKLKEILAVALSAKTDNSKRNNFKICFEDLEDVRSEYQKRHSALLNEIYADQDEVKICIAHLHAFHKDVTLVKEIYDDLFSQNTITPQTTGTNRRLTLNPNAPGSSQQTPDFSHSFPKIDIVKFSGDINQFPTFYDLFKSMIHDNPNIPNIQKYSLLVTYLEGAPRELVTQLPASDANYPIVFDNFVKRYKNDRILAQNYWNAIDSAPKVNSDDPTALRNLLDIFTKNIEALKTVGLQPDFWDFVLAQKLLKSVDCSIQTRFEVFHGKPTEIPSYQAIYNFLDQHCSSLFIVGAGTSSTTQTSSKPKFSQKPQNQYQKFPNSRQPPRAFLSASKPQNKCTLCTRDHNLSVCPDYLAKSPQERYTFLKDQKFCINCTSNLHKTFQCKSTNTCRFCQKRHHTTLHFDSDVNTGPHQTFSREIPKRQETDNSLPVPTHSQSQSACLSSHNLNTSGTLISTALFQIKDVRGHYQTVRGVLDSASHLSFVSLKCANKLGLPRININTEVLGIGETSMQSKLGAINMIIRPCNNNHSDFTLSVSGAVILPQICSSLPLKEVNTKNWHIIDNIKIADPNFNRPGAVDVLLGADIFPYLLRDGRLVGNSDEPIAINSIFGYILMGKINIPQEPIISVSLICQISNQMLHDSLTKFWEIENIPETQVILSPQDEACEKIFKNTFSRNDEGRYIVTLPFREKIEPIFPNSRQFALKRFLSLENRLSRTPETYKKYSDFMQEYLDLDHMELVENPQVIEKSYYIPHHHIERPESLSTKLRVVFNASAVSLTNNGKLSLNDTLYAGPKLQKDICSILLNFRLHEIALCCDISKMYRGILIASQHQNYQKILWRFHKSEPIQEYRLKTVTYGTTPAPYLALRVLQQLAEDEKHKYPHAAKVLLNDSFVDDFVTGCSSEKEAISLQKELTMLLDSGGFKLYKWASNSKKVLAPLPESDINPTALSLNCFYALKQE